MGHMYILLKVVNIKVKRGRNGPRCEHVNKREKCLFRVNQCERVHIRGREPFSSALDSF